MKFNFDFMKHRKLFIMIGAIVVVGSLLIFMANGLSLSIDFTGGNVVQVQLNKESDISVGEVREVVGEVLQSNAMIQEFGESAFIIRTQDVEEDARARLIDALKAKYADMQVIGFEKVGPVVGAELRHDAFIGMIVALIAILIYITVRFQFRFAVVSVLALIHDTVAVIGAFSITGMEVNATFIAAVLTIVGYSLNNTIIIIDRIRENWKDLRSKKIVKLVNESINQTLSRTINTTLTTILPVIALYIWG
ncbi:MAG: protein translocase subunit SecF, partial [Synergistaceae bacterium]|nr:protein translocase subunit SecF [Synergistaceae bacterium]